MDWNQHLPSILAWGGSILTGVFTLLGVWLANRSSLKQLTTKLNHEAERQTREASRARLEELYSLIDGWAGAVVIHHMTYGRVMKGELTYNEAMDLVLNKNNAIDAKRLFTLAELYFPSAHGALQEIKSYRDAASDVLASFTRSYKQNGEPSRDHAIALTTALQKFNAAITKYQAELAAHAKDS